MRATWTAVVHFRWYDVSVAVQPRRRMAEPCGGWQRDHAVDHQRTGVEVKRKPTRAEQPPDWWLDPRVRKLLLSVMTPSLGHLLINWENVDTGKRQPRVYSGFFMGHRDYFFWVTAGHVIHEIQALLANPKFRVKEARLRDGRPLSDKFASSVPVSIEADQMLGIDAETEEEAFGLDFGILRLSPLVFAGLLSNPGTLFLPAEDSLGGGMEQAAGLYVIGAPGERVRRASSIDVQFEIHCLPVRLLSNAPAELRQFPRSLYGKLVDLGPDNDPMNSIVGMSGGPVFAVEYRTEEEFGFRLVGIQSSWHRPTRQIRVSSIVDVIRFIDRGIDALGQ